MNSIISHSQEGTPKYKKHTSTTLAPMKNKTNIRGHISTKLNTSR